MPQQTIEATATIHPLCPLKKFKHSCSHTVSLTALQKSFKAMSTSGDGGAHILVFPFPTSGHVIPFLDLSRLLLTRGLNITVLVTPPNLPLLQPLLSISSSIQPLVLSPPDTPTPRLVAKIRALSELYNPILHWFRSHPSPPVAIISDFFLGWTHHLACELGVPRVVFWPSGAFTSSVSNTTWQYLPKTSDHRNNEDFLISFPTVPNSPAYPLWQMSELFREFKEGEPDWEFFRDGMLANMLSWGVVFNSFSGLERVYIDHLKIELRHNRVWAVGPLLTLGDDLMDPTTRGGCSAVPTHEVMSWLDEKADDSVVYVCFGSRVVLTSQQMNVLAAALECSGLHFIMCVKADEEGHVGSSGGEIPDGFEDRVAGRGFIIKGWAPQVVILRHRAVGVFVTHCGWNSVLEGLTAGVVMLTWPMGADQFTNAKLLVDQLGVAVRACEGGTRTMPDPARLPHLLAESVGGNMPERVRAREMRDAALKAVKKGGSSHRDLDEFVRQLSEPKCKSATK